MFQANKECGRREGERRGGQLSIWQNSFTFERVCQVPNPTSNLFTYWIVFTPTKAVGLRFHRTSLNHLFYCWHCWIWKLNPFEQKLATKLIIKPGPADKGILSMSEYLNYHNQTEEVAAAAPPPTVWTAWWPEEVSWIKFLLTNSESSCVRYLSGDPLSCQNERYVFTFVFYCLCEITNKVRLFRTIRKSGEYRREDLPRL